MLLAQKLRVREKSCAAQNEAPLVVCPEVLRRVVLHEAHRAVARSLNFAHPRSRLRADCGWAFACASTVVAAWARICERVRFAVSSAKSVSRIALSAADAFSNATPRLFTVEPIVNFWNAPSRPRSWLTCLIALSTIFCAVTRLSLVSEFVPPLDSELR